MLPLPWSKPTNFCSANPRAINHEAEDLQALENLYPVGQQILG